MAVFLELLQVLLRAREIKLSEHGGDSDEHYNEEEAYDEDDEEAEEE